jgi:long-subunit fatty acid transport protein
MKKILLISFLLSQLSIYAQDSPKWNVGIQYSLDNLSLDNGQNNDYLVTQGNINGYGIELDKNNYTIGLNAQYFLNKKVSLSSGILYSNKDFTGTFNCATCDFFGSFPETIKQRFLVIPLSIDYNLQFGNLKPILKAGFNNNIETDNGLKEQSKSYFLEAFVGILMNYEIIENCNIGVGYNYQTALTDLYKTDEYNLKTNTFYLQINYRIK